ncbi:PspA/IM30 family protein [Methylobacterium brachiatum]|jgi:phage shock protein A|uniref:Phage shock protein A n=1 Tax=Methylobacterium brachiatum TaxID=269660 RepID=A0AAJ1WXF3_9HYPH|nr:PspA/IM30 family protein [Methylobacterium brachiatum]AYO82106.1 phage shock protein C [Methylobacterium brachiatum]MCB4805978.1 PspA/IM30 family protein [Methylobacterium brachiatum]MDQ0544170.1 phage shock protein A [Methylobacterium brachiatum]
MRTLSLLMRGAIADNAQALHDANAVTILRQQIRDAAGALATARRELAVAMAYHAAEARALDAIGARIETLSDGARRALADGREDLGSEAAVHIAALEDERSDRRAAAARFAAEIERLKRLVGQGGERLRDLDRGLQTARTTEALRRAGLEGRRVTALSAGALGEAERTLARLREAQAAEADAAEALAGLEAEAASGIEADLDAAGYGRPRTDPRAVLDRLRAQA